VNENETQMYEYEQGKHKQRINSHYSHKSVMNCMNMRWVVGSNADNPDLEIPKFGGLKNFKFVSIS